MSSMEVTIHWPEGPSTSWRTGQPIIDAEGVGPLTAPALGWIMGLLTAAELVEPIGEGSTEFLARASAGRVMHGLRALLTDLDPARERAEDENPA